MNTLVEQIHGLIAQHDLKQANRFRKHFNNTQALNVFSIGVLNSLNRYWRLELGGIAKDTIDERECLVDNVDESVWLHNFATTVLPTIVSHRLPVSVR